MVSTSIFSHRNYTEESASEDSEDDESNEEEEEEEEVKRKASLTIRVGFLMRVK